MHTMPDIEKNLNNIQKILSNIIRYYSSNVITLRCAFI